MSLPTKIEAANRLKQNVLEGNCVNLTFYLADR
jgi:hypothetical protein